jgi:hypothetical protein
LKSRVPKSKDVVAESKKCLDDWKLAQKIEEAKKLVLDDPAIKGNADVNRDYFDAYVKQVSKALSDFESNRESFSLSKVADFVL